MTELGEEIIEAERVLAHAMRMPPGPERMEAQRADYLFNFLAKF